MTKIKPSATEIEEDAFVGDAPMRILVATANRTSGAVLKAMLGEPGKSAVWVPQRSALAEDSAGAHFADIIFCDISHADEIERAIRSFGANGSALIALLAGGRGDLRTQAEAAGFDGCVSTPVTPGPLLELTRAVCERIGRKWDGPENSPIPAGKPAIDVRALEDLADLGGPEFVQDIVSQFLDDATALLKTLHAAMRSGDTSAFRDQAHALRSCAANVGARNVYASCLELRGIATRDLVEFGEAHMSRLSSEVTQARDALAAYVSNVRRHEAAAG